MNKKNSKNKKGIKIMAAGLLLITAAFLLVIYNLWDESRANSAAAHVMEQMDLPRLESHSDEVVIPDYILNPDMEMPTMIEVVIPDYILNPDMEMPTMIIDGHEYIGVLDIPALDLSLPIMSDWSYPKLKIAPNRFKGSAYTDNLILAAHNYRTHFGSLNLLSVDDQVSFTDVDGNIFSYKVAEVEVLKSTDVEEMEAGDWDLTLFTCTLSGENRTTVRCLKSNF